MSPKLECPHSSDPALRWRRSKMALKATTVRSDVGQRDQAVPSGPLSDGETCPEGRALHAEGRPRPWRRAGVRATQNTRHPTSTPGAQRNMLDTHILELAVTVDGTIALGVLAASFGGAGTLGPDAISGLHTLSLVDDEVARRPAPAISPRTPVQWIECAGFLSLLVDAPVWTGGTPGDQMAADVIGARAVLEVEVGTGDGRLGTNAVPTCALPHGDEPQQDEGPSPPFPRRHSLSQDGLRTTSGLTSRVHATRRSQRRTADNPTFRVGNHAEPR
jgi:hypothetical protein